MFVRYNPAHSLGQTLAIMNDVRRQFDQLLGSNAAWSPTFPRLDAIENESDYQLTAEVPGLTTEALQLSVQGDVLTIKGERQTPVPQGYRVLRQERTPFRFERSVSLPRDVDPEHITAKLEDGLLRLTLPKRARANRQITINV